MGELCKYWGFMNDAVVIITYTIISTSTVTSSSNQMDYFPHRIIDSCSVCEALVVHFLSFLSLKRAHTHTHTHTDHVSFSFTFFCHFLSLLFCFSLFLSSFLFLTFSLSFSFSHILSHTFSLTPFLSLSFPLFIFSYPFFLKTCYIVICFAICTFTRLMQQTSSL